MCCRVLSLSQKGFRSALVIVHGPSSPQLQRRIVSETSKYARAGSHGIVVIQHARSMTTPPAAMQVSWQAGFHGGSVICSAHRLCTRRHPEQRWRDVRRHDGAGVLLVSVKWLAFPAY